MPPFTAFSNGISSLQKNPLCEKQLPPASIQPAFHYELLKLCGQNNTQPSEYGMQILNQMTSKPGLTLEKDEISQPAMRVKNP